MEHSVSELLEVGAPQSKVLEAAEESPKYERHEEDDKYAVYKGPRLLVGIPGEGLYTEELDEEVDGVTILDQEAMSDQDVCTYVKINSDTRDRTELEDLDRWDNARETTYRIEGYWKEIMDKVLGQVSGGMATPIEEWEDVEETLRETENDEYELSGSTSPGEFQLYINNEEGEAMIEFNHNFLRMHEKGETETDLEQVEGLQIDKVITGDIDEDFKPQSTLNEGVKR